MNAQFKYWQPYQPSRLRRGICGGWCICGGGLGLPPLGMSCSAICTASRKMPCRVSSPDMLAWTAAFGIRIDRAIGDRHGHGLVARSAAQGGLGLPDALWARSAW